MNATGWKEKDDRTIAEMQMYMERKRLDAFIPSKATHIAYLMNYWDLIHSIIPWEEMTGFLVVLSGGEAFAVGETGCFAGPDDAQVHPWWLKERINTPRPGRRTLDRLAEKIKGKGLSKARIGIERKWMPLALYEELHFRLPDVEFVEADLLVPQIRFIKTSREQELLRKAANIGLASMDAYMVALRNGADELEANIVRAKKALELGGEWLGGPYRLAWTGGTDETPDWWDEDALRGFKASKLRRWRGLPENLPFLVTHFEARYQWYLSDMAWHQFYGAEPDDGDMLAWGDKKIKYADAKYDFAVLRQAQSEVLNQIKPGMDHLTAKRQVGDYIASHEEFSKHITNYYIHGLGLDVHEEPILTGYVDIPTPLDGAIYYQPGAVVSSEWFTALWTVEEPFVMTAFGWIPLVELRGVTCG